MNTTIPVTVENSVLKDKYRIKLVLDFGDFYVFDKYIIGEVREGQHVGWDDVKIMIEKVYEHFGSSDVDLAYISNRIHSYSLQPKDWLNFYRERHKVRSFSIVAYNKLGVMNIALERIFSKTPIKKFSSLEAAVDWVLHGKTDTVEQ
ncbi:MAG: hypothetical protein AAF489_07785 [Bacteroidota bacterium]